MFLPFFTVFFIQTLNWQLQWVRVMSLFNRRRFHIFLAGADVLASLPVCLFVCCERYEVYFFFSIFNFFFQSLSLQALREKCSNSSEIIDDMTQKNPSKFVLVLECKNPRKVFNLPFFHFNMIRKNVYDAKHSIFFFFFFNFEPFSFVQAFKKNRPRRRFQSIQQRIL